MTDLIQVKGRPVIDYTARDYDRLLQALRARIPELLPEWTDYESEVDFGNVLLQLFAHMGDILSYYQDRVANESFLGTAQTRRSIIQHLRLIGYELSTAAPASATLALYFPKIDYQGRRVTIAKGAAFATKSQSGRSSVRFEYTGTVNIEIDPQQLPEAPWQGKQYYYFGPNPGEANTPLVCGIPVEEGRLIRTERLGVSDGSPHRQFVLAHPRLILRPLGQGQAAGRDIELLVDDDGTVERWNLRETLAFSQDAQHDFVVAIDENDQATIKFGDGRFGAIPREGAEIFATYRVGGGAHGNVPAGSITTIVDAPQLNVLAVQISNPLAATGGADRESIEHAVFLAPQVYRSQQRAVTADDYRALALNYQGVGKVRAVASSANIVQLNIAPASGGYVSDTLRAGLLAYFEDKRPVTTRITIADVDYVDVYVSARVEVESYYEQAEVAERVRAAAARLLAFEQVDFKQKLYLSKWYEAIEAVAGVRSVYISEFRRNPPGADTEPGVISMGDNEIPQVPDNLAYAGGIRLEFSEGS